MTLSIVILQTNKQRDAFAAHNEHRLSGGNIFTMLRKRTGRAHIKDACTYSRLFPWKKKLKTCS